MSATWQRRWVALGATLAVLLTARLGWWQLDRAAQKLALQVAMADQAERPVLEPGQLAADAATALAQSFRRVRITGEWWPQRTLYLDNRQMGGRPGFFVVTPLQLPGGEVVLVQRGWLPRDIQDRSRIAAYRTPAGAVPILARIAPSASRMFQLGQDAPGPIRQNLDLADVAGELGRPLRPVLLIELSTDANQADGLARDWPPPAIDVQKHYGYAAQWFALCVLTLGLYVWFQIVRPRRPPRG